LDHRWGRNVSDLGLVSSGATLAARLLVAPWIVFTNAPGFFEDGAKYWITSLDTEVAWFEFTWPMLGLHFPYGLEDDLEPDEPL